MKKLSLFSLLFAFSSVFSEDPANPEVIYPIEIVGRSWIDIKDIRNNWTPIIDYDVTNYVLFVLTPLTAPTSPPGDSAIQSDTRGVDKDKKYRLWSKVVLNAKVKNGDLTVSIVSRDVDGGLEAFGALQGTAFITDPPELKKEGTKYKFTYLCYGSPHPAAEVGLQLVRRRTSTNIWHRVYGEIYLEGGALKYDFKFFAVSSFPMHTLYVNQKLIQELRQTFISDLWVSDPTEPTFVGQRP